MSKVVFILGAGASRDCGGPLMSDFLDTARDLLAAGRVPGKEESFKTVFRAISGLQRVHSKAQFDINNIESVFTALEMAQTIGRLPHDSGGEPIAPEAAIRALKILIVTTLEESIRFPVVTRGGRESPSFTKTYGCFADLLAKLRTKRPQLTFSILTFNYDLALEASLHMSGQEVDYCLNPGGRGVPVLKLHGSVNWATKKDTKEIEALSLNSCIQCAAHSDDGSYRLRIGSTIADSGRCRKGEIDDEPLIVPPTWNKSEYYRQLGAVWANAAKHLSEAEYIFVSGYSLPTTDTFFRHLYALGTVGESPLRAFNVYTIDTENQVEGRFRSLLGPGGQDRFKFESKFFSDMFEHVKEVTRID